MKNFRSPMKFTIIFSALLMLAYSCGMSPEEQKIFDEENINSAKEKIDSLFFEVEKQYYDNDNLDLHNTAPAKEIFKFQYSEYPEVVSYAKAYNDSISEKIKYWNDIIYGELFQYAEQQGWNKISNSEYKKLEKQLKLKTDEFETNSFYRDPSSPNYVNMNAFYIYYSKISDDSDEARLLIKAQYLSDEWLFIESVDYSIDGEAYSGDGDFEEWESDNDTEIYEWSTGFDPSYNILVKILKSKTAKIRFQGRQYYDDRYVTSAQKSAIYRVLKVYYGLYIKNKVNYKLKA
jgi:hypothetical protein